MCLKKRPYATKMEPLHVCKDEQQNTYTDASFFRALRKAYYQHRSWEREIAVQAEQNRVCGGMCFPVFLSCLDNPDVR